MTIFGFEQTWFLALILTVPRLLGAFLAMPFLGPEVLPGLARNALVMIISMYTAPMMIPYLDQMNFDMGFLVFLVLKEAAVGFMFGYLVSIPFWALGTAGFIVDLQRGLMSAQLFSNVLADQTSPLGDFFNKLAVVLLFTTGGFLLLIEVLMTSYQVWPIHTFFPSISVEVSTMMLKQFAYIFSLGVLIAGPLMATMFIVEIGAALVSRYVPQLNVFLLVMPIKSGVVILLLIFYITFIAKHMRDYFLTFGDLFRMLDSTIR